MQLPLFKPASEWSPPSLADLPSWAGAKRVALDTETCDPQLRKLGPGVRRGAYIAGVSFAIEDGPAHYLPIRHAMGRNLPAANVIRYLRDQARTFDRAIVGANLQYDLDFLAQEGIQFEQAVFRDVQVAEPLLDELADSYSLEALGQKWCRWGKEEGLLKEAARAYGVDPKMDLWRLSPEYVGVYAEQDAALPLLISRRQERQIEEEELQYVYDLESRLLPVLVKMRRRGVLIDQDHLARVEERCLEEERKALNEVRRSTGVALSPDDIWNAQAVARPLVEIGVEVPRTKQGQPSIKKEVLGSIEHPVAEGLQQARRWNKIRTTFCASIKTHMCAGRIHCTFNQLRREREEDGGLSGGRFGRLSSEDPNLQQQPARDPEIGPLWRKIYAPDGDGLWAALDYSQQEPRWTTHWGEVLKLSGAREAGDKYRNDPETDNHQMIADMAGIERKPAKNIYLGIIYGMGGPKLCRDLGLPLGWRVRASKGRERVSKLFEDEEEARAALRRAIDKGWEASIKLAAGPEGQRLMDEIDRKVPFLRGAARAFTRRAERDGFIRTWSGRKCRFPMQADGGYDWCHKALNRAVQGSSADQTKEAMVRIDEAGHPLQLQVHDEIDLTVSSRQHAGEVAEIMEHCVELTVPSKVDVEVGPSWGEAS